MNAQDKKEIRESKTVGVWYDGLAGISLKKIEYDINDYAIVSGYTVGAIISKIV